MGTALHSLPLERKTSVHVKEYTFAIFLDIEGAVNNVEPDAIVRTLSTLHLGQNLEDSNLHSRGHVLSENTRRWTREFSPHFSGTLQSIHSWGGRILVNDAIALVDDIVIIKSGICPQTQSDRILDCLLIPPRPIRFSTTRYKFSIFSRHSICGTRLTLSPEVKYLDLILDRKLNWRANLAARTVRAAYTAVKSESDRVFDQESCAASVLRLSILTFYMILLSGELIWTNNTTSNFLTRSEGLWHLYNRCSVHHPNKWLVRGWSCDFCENWLSSCGILSFWFRGRTIEILILSPTWIYTIMMLETN